MHDDDVLDLLTDIDFSASTTKAEQFADQAEAMTVGEHGRASFLLAAGEHFQMRGDYDAARRCFERALDDGGETGTDPLANLLDLALETGDESTAEDLAKQLRALVRQDAVGPATCHFVGEAYEQHGRLREAMRWFTIPLAHVEPDEAEDVDYLCLVGRLRVRQELGLVEDRYDVAADAALAHQVQRHG